MKNIRVHFLLRGTLYVLLLASSISAQIKFDEKLGSPDNCNTMRRDLEHINSKITHTADFSKRKKLVTKKRNLQRNYEASCKQERMKQ